MSNERSIDQSYSSIFLVCLLAFVPEIARAETLEQVRNHQLVVLGHVPDFAPFSTQLGAS